MTLDLETRSGELFLDNKIIAPVCFRDFIDTITSIGIDYECCTPSLGWSNIGFPIEFNGKTFSLIIIFREENLYSLFLSWHDGVSGRMGYEVSERELKADYQTLTAFLEKVFTSKAQKEHDHISNFNFTWGRVTANYSIRSLTVGISIAWEN